MLTGIGQRLVNCTLIGPMQWITFPIHSVHGEAIGFFNRSLKVAFVYVKTSSGEKWGQLDGFDVPFKYFFEANVDKVRKI